MNGPVVANSQLDYVQKFLELNNDHSANDTAAPSRPMSVAEKIKAGRAPLSNEPNHTSMKLDM